MSAAFLRVCKPLLRDDVANLDTIDIWVTRKFLTAAEADEARAYWHETHPPTDPDTDGEQSDTPTVTEP